MNILPIYKIIIASFAFAITNWRKLVFISIVPLVVAMPFLLELPNLLLQINNIAIDNAASVDLPSYIFFFILLFIYAITVLSINIYRLVILGSGAISFIPKVKFTVFIKFFALNALVGFALILPVMLTGYAFMQLIGYFLVIPIVLNLINIAIGEPYVHKWKLSFMTALNLLLLQLILPEMIIITIDYLSAEIGIGIVLSLIVQVIVFYWRLISLALCYQLITKTVLKK